MKRSINATCYAAVIAVLLMFVFILEGPVYGQGSRSITNSPQGPFADSLERRDREVALRSLPATMGEKKAARRVSPEVLKQINEDFTRIQIVRRELVDNIAAGKRFEYARLSNDASEIRKRATRLKNSLVLFDERADNSRELFTKVEFDEQEIQEAASKLCLEISRFIENPIFKSTGAYRAQDAAEAGRTLDTVINLSLNVRDSAERLRKSGR